ncbi:MAG: FxSxx-COOH system tetratricopeptide repeat protein [Actinophytocola sp.]|uniref:FxSxx-COOH system tetratricopeptide repeat protein n=1 Tax=Actinophytocola sp. TaxID=1872138 RepID=UPI003C7696BB
MTDAADRLSTRELSADEVSDAVWLAARISAAASESRTDGTAPLTPPAPETRSQPPTHTSPPRTPPDVEEPPPAYAVLARGVQLNSLEERQSPPSSAPAPPTRSLLPDLPAGLSKALRPAQRQVPSRLDVELDEEETAVAAAESGRWLPVHRATNVQPYEVLLVIDRSLSMEIWTRTATAFRHLIERQGAFSDVTTVYVDTDDKHVTSLRTGAGAACTPARFADPTGRKLILVISDGVGNAWRTGSMFSVMARWARTCHVAFVHVLPVDKWDWTGVRVEPRKLRGMPPVTTNGIPVLALEARYLRRWAELVAGANEVRLPVLVPPADEDEIPVPDDTPAVDRLERFWSTASPEGARLAGLLAAAPLNRSVIRAIHGTLLPSSDTWNLAEVFLSGLIRRVTSSHESVATSVEFDFRSGVRRRLLATVTRDETAHVQRVVEDVLGRDEPSLSDLRNVIAQPDRITLPKVTERNAPLLAVMRDVLLALSGPYRRQAHHLTAALKGAGKVIAFGPDVKPTLSPGVPVTTLSSETGTELPRSHKRQPSVWGGVPLRNVNFIGRKDLLDALHATLAKSTRISVLPHALQGMGGIGKSQIAVEFVYRYAAEYDLVWWIPSENLSEIQASLVKLAQRLELPVEMSIDTAVPAVLDALSTDTHRRWLLVFDNADDPADVRDFWPRRGEGHIIVTSRNSQWAEVAQTVEVDVFRRAESRELLQRRNNDLLNEDADRLAAVLGDLPLAIEQAAAWRAETGMAVDEYLRLFEDKRAELLESRAPADYDVAVEAAWNVSLDRLREENPGALELLEVCAFFSPEPISKDLFSGAQNIPVSEDLEQILADPIVLARAIREINRYSLAKIDHRTNTLTLHRLVQLVLRNKLNPEQQERVRHTAHLLLANKDPRSPDNVENWDTYGALLPHIRAANARDCTDKWVRKLAINAVNYLFAFGDPAGALDMAKSHAKYWHEKLGEKHRDTLVISRWWGRTLRALGRYDESRVVAERTLDFMRETLGATHEETLLTMHGVASDLRAKGDFQRAKEVNEFAYQAALERFGEEDPDTLAAANNYALSLRLVGDFVGARDLDEQTWRHKQSVLGADHRHTLLTLDNWSVDLRETGDYLGARSEQEDTVRRMRAQLSDRHPMTLSAIKNLAIAYRKAGDHANRKSLNLATEASEALTAKYGEKHPDTMSALMELSIEHRQDGNLIEARRIGEHVKDLYEQTWGHKHPFSSAAATNLAVTLRLLGMVDQARALNEQALTDMRESLGVDHPFTLVCATNLASDLAASDQVDAAYALNQETLERSNRVLGEDHPSSLALQVNLALDLRGLNRNDEAATTQHRAVERLRGVLGPKHPATNNAQFNHRANCDIDPMQI